MTRLELVGGGSGGGSGGVSTVSNSNGTLIVSPTSGNVVASVNKAANSVAPYPLWIINCWGDSLTQGSSYAAPGNWPTSYPSQLSTSTGRPVVKYAYPGQTSPTIANNMAALPGTWNNASIIWVGTNDWPTSYASVVSEVAAMVADLASVSNTDYIVLSPIPFHLSTFVSGQSLYTDLQAVTATLSSAYGSKFVNIWTTLVNSYNSSLPLDVIDFGLGLPPNSLLNIYGSGTLGTAITSSTQQSFSISNIVGTGPSQGQWIVIDNERILINTLNGGTVSACTRGYLGTTATTHSLNAAASFYDYIHLTTAGYAIVASAVKTALAANQASPPTSMVSVTNIPSIFASPQPIGTTNPTTASFLGIQVTGTDVYPGFPDLGPDNYLYMNFLSPGVNNCYIGFNCGNNISNASSGNTGLGSQALAFLTSSCASNTAIGVNALYSLTSDSGNTAIGANAMWQASSPGQSTAVGYYAMGNSSCGNLCTAVGYYSLANSQNAGNGQDTATGFYSLYNNTTGYYNSAFGSKAGQTNATGNSLTFLGYEADVNADGYANSTAVGAQATITASNQMVFGNSSVASYVFSGIITVYNGIPTSGNGVPANYGNKITINLNTTSTNVVSYTTPASIGLYRISWTLSCVTSSTPTLTLAYTDTKAGAQTVTLYNSAMTGNTTTGGVYILEAATSTSITITGSDGTALGDIYASAAIEAL